MIVARGVESAIRLVLRLVSWRPAAAVTLGLGECARVDDSIACFDVSISLS